MFKFLIPLLLLLTTSLAYAGDDPLKLHHHFDPLAPAWDGSLETVSPMLPKVPPIPPVPVMAGKCTTDGLKDVSAYLHSIGYTAMIVASDRVRDNVRNEIMYNLNDNSILSLSMWFDKSLKDVKEEDNKINKICVEWQGTNSFGDGPTFKKFVLGQELQFFNEEADQADQAHKDRAKKEHDPYQGDPSKINFMNIRAAYP